MDVYACGDGLAHLGSKSKGDTALACLSAIPAVGGIFNLLRGGRKLDKANDAKKVPKKVETAAPIVWVSSRADRMIDAGAARMDELLESRRASRSPSYVSSHKGGGGNRGGGGGGGGGGADNPTVYRTPQRGNMPDELQNGLNPQNHMDRALNQSAHVGSESVARDFAHPNIGTHENTYIKFEMDPDFDAEFAPYRFRYDRAGPDRWEYQIPLDKIERFNELTISRTEMPW